MALLALHTDGKLIKDSDGNTVRLRGPNGGGLGDTCTGFLATTWNEANVRSHLAAMAGWGANCIRIMLSIRWWLENSKEVYYATTELCDRPYRQNVIEIIELAAEYGLYVIVDFWSIDTNYAYGSRTPSTQDYLPYPPYASTQNFQTIRNSADFIEVWTGDSATSTFLARFQAVDTPAVTSPYVNNSGASPPSISEALSGYNHVIYGLYNEPSGADANWSAVVAAIIDALRTASDDHLVLAQCGFCGSFYAWADVMDAEVTGKTNVVFSNHIYRSDGSFPGNPYTYADLYATLMVTATNPPGFGLGYVLDTLGYPVIIGEIGSGTSAEEQQYFANTLQILNEETCGFFGWEWRSGSLYTGSFNPTTMGTSLIAAMDYGVGGSKTFTFDAQLLASKSKAFTFDADVAASQTATFTMDGVLRDVYIKTFTFDSLLQQSNTAPFSFDGYLIALQSNIFDFDAMLKLEKTKTFTFDSLLQASQTKGLSYDALLLEQNSIFSFDAQLRAFIETRPELGLVRMVLKKMEKEKIGNYCFEAGCVEPGCDNADTPMRRALRAMRRKQPYG